MIIKWRNKLNTNCFSCPNSTVVEWQSWDQNLGTLLPVLVFIATWNHRLVCKGGRTLAGPCYSPLGTHWLPRSCHYQTYNPLQYSFLGNSAECDQRGICGKFGVWLSHIWLFVTPWTVAYQAPLCSWVFPGNSTGVAISLSRGSSQPKRSNLGLLHCRETLYRLSHQGLWWTWSLNGY